jgi:hypothetical protein
LFHHLWGNAVEIHPAHHIFVRRIKRGERQRHGATAKATGTIHGLFRQNHVSTVTEKNLRLFLQVLRRREAIARNLPAMHTELRGDDAGERNGRE